MKTRWGRKYVTAADLAEYRVTVGHLNQLLILG
jgi:hypothetical protein